jgi:hypothetical protein
MTRFRRPQGLTMWPMLLVLLCAPGCARPAGLQTSDGAGHVDQHQVPFHNGDDAAASARQADSPAPPDRSLKPETGLPFHDSQNLPSGTLLTVRLKNSISSESPSTDGVFEAIVDEPVAIEGSQVIPLGTGVAGRVESTRSSNVKRNRGYVRLVLDSIHLAAGNLPIQTSSLFVMGSAGDTHVPQSEVQQTRASTTLIHLEKGRRLTFRLTESVSLAASERTRVDR